MATQSEIEAVLYTLERTAAGDLHDPLRVMLVPGGKSTLGGKVGWDANLRRWVIVLDTTLDFKTLAHAAFHELAHIVLGHVVKERPIVTEVLRDDLQMMTRGSPRREADWKRSHARSRVIDEEAEANEYADLVLSPAVLKGLAAYVERRQFAPPSEMAPGTRRWVLDKVSGLKRVTFGLPAGVEIVDLDPGAVLGMERAKAARVGLAGQWDRERLRYEAERARADALLQAGR